MMTSSLPFRITDFGPKQQVYSFDLVISHPILMRLNRVDHTLIEMNPRRNDDVIKCLSGSLILYKKKHLLRF